MIHNLMDMMSTNRIVLYDDQCYLCVKFAKIVNFLARGRLRFVGHYTTFGENLRKSKLDDSALEMFWFIDEQTAYGGRAAIIPLISSILHGYGNSNIRNIQESTDIGCKNTKAVFVRSFSLFSNSKKINLGGK